MKNLVLVGMMGCGKSTCARLLHEATGRPSVDTDYEIQQRTGKTVTRIFNDHGEAYFRDLETELCRELAAQSGLIIACGGGLPLREENRKLLGETGLVVYLRRPVEEIYRPEKLRNRPLARMGREDFFRRFQEREPIFLEMADYIVDSQPIKTDTAAKVREVWEKYGQE
jgi:shikimate kinase